MSNNERGPRKPGAGRRSRGGGENRRSTRRRGQVDWALTVVNVSIDPDKVKIEYIDIPEDVDFTDMSLRTARLDRIDGISNEQILADLRRSRSGFEGIGGEVTDEQWSGLIEELDLTELDSQTPPPTES